MYCCLLACVCDRLLKKCVICVGRYLCLFYGFSFVPVSFSSESSVLLPLSAFSPRSTGSQSRPDGRKGKRTQLTHEKETYSIRKTIQHCVGQRGRESPHTLHIPIHGGECTVDTRRREAILSCVACDEATLLPPCRQSRATFERCSHTLFSPSLLHDKPPDTIAVSPFFFFSLPSYPPLLSSDRDSN